MTESQTRPHQTSPELPPAGTTLVELRDIGKRYGNIIALRGVSTSVRAAEVTCVLGDNGAGKSTFIKIIAGAHDHSDGVMTVDGVRRRFSSPRDALDAGIATVYQDLAVVALMPIWRNFFLGSELRRGPLLDVGRMRAISGRWASTCATSTSPSARCPAVNGSASRSPARCTSAPGC